MALGVDELQTNPSEYAVNIAFQASLIGADFSYQDISGYNLQDVCLVGCNFDNANLSNTNFTNCIMTNSSFRGANCHKTNFTKANVVKGDFSRANLHLADFTDADATGCDFTMAYMKSTLFLRSKVRSSHFRRVYAKNALFINADCRRCDFVGAELLGARFNGSKVWGVRNLEFATFKWWLSPFGGPPSYTERPGWEPLDSSVLGGISLRENSGRIRE